MIIYTKSGHRVELLMEAVLLTRNTEKGNLLVEIRDSEGKTVGLFLDPQAIVP